MKNSDDEITATLLSLNAEIEALKHDHSNEIPTQSIVRNPTDNGKLVIPECAITFKEVVNKVIGLLNSDEDIPINLDTSYDETWKHFEELEEEKLTALNNVYGKTLADLTRIKKSQVEFTKLLQGPLPPAFHAEGGPVNDGRSFAASSPL